MIIGVCGSIGAGKETLTSYFREKGFVYLETSLILKQRLGQLGREITRENMQNYGDEIRMTEGVSAIMKLMHLWHHQGCFRISLMCLITV